MTGRHDEIADTLTTEILTGQYRVGERLPSERDLAARFGVNRGAVREAIKKLEGLGIATVQPGGARVGALEEASLDVIGHMLAVQPVPDAALVEQILEVLTALMGLAADSTLRRASDEQIEDIRMILARARDAIERGQDDFVARLELPGALLEASGNLVTRLIARGVLLQLVSNMTRATVHHRVHRPEATVEAMNLLDRALAERDRKGVRIHLETLSELNRTSVLHALRAVHEEHETNMKDIAAR